MRTNDSIVELNMGGDEEVGFGGYDGKVLATRGTPLVPEGRSVWEMGVSADFRDKANADYKKRSEDPLGVDPTETTFVFVTPRLWSNSDEWVRTKKAAGKWRDVMVFDAGDIYAAMEQATVEHIAFSELVGKPANSVWTLERWWERFIAVPGGLLTADLVLSGREDAAADLVRILSSEDRTQIWITAPSVDDVLAFVAATLVTQSVFEGRDLLERSLVVFEPGALLFLSDQSRLLILIPFEESLVKLAELATANTVILRAAFVSTTAIDLPAPQVAATQARLEGQGIERDDAHNLALAAFRSFYLLRHRLLNVPTPESESILRGLIASKTSRRAWLLGSWNAERTGDTEVLAGLVGSEVDYEVLTELSRVADPIFTKVGSSWKVISPEAHVAVIAQQITSEDLAAFESTVQTVLGAVDPTLELPAGDRWKAAIYGNVRIHSGDLRKGIATTLAAFGALGGELQVGSGLTLRGWAALVVRAVLERANADPDGRLWLSLIDLLPLLAEAAPDMFIDAIDVAISSGGSLRAHLFTDSEDENTGSSPHVYVLWALETLAWSPDYFSAAVRVLRALVDIDPGGRLSNRPDRSLVNAFRPWLPQTSATAETRLAVLRSIVRGRP